MNRLAPETPDGKGWEFISSISTVIEPLRACSAGLKNKLKYCSSWLLWEKKTVLTEITVHVNSDSWGGCPASQPNIDSRHHHVQYRLDESTNSGNGIGLKLKLLWNKIAPSVCTELLASSHADTWQATETVALLNWYLKCSPCLVATQFLNSCYSTCHIECLRPMYGALNVDEKKN